MMPGFVGTATGGSLGGLLAWHIVPELANAGVDWGQMPVTGALVALGAMVGTFLLTLAYGKADLALGASGGALAGGCGGVTLGCFVGALLMILATLFTSCFGALRGLTPREMREEQARVEQRASAEALMLMATLGGVGVASGTVAGLAGTLLALPLVRSSKESRAS
jgi:hypothetical protein